jgi:hypothetical protein
MVCNYFDDSGFGAEFGSGTEVMNTWSPQLMDQDINNKDGHFFIDLGYFILHYRWQINWDRDNNTLNITTAQ